MSRCFNAPSEPDVGLLQVSLGELAALGGLRARKVFAGFIKSDPLKQARLSLAAGSPGSERTALECLIEAVSKLQAESTTAIRSDGTRVIALPIVNPSVVLRQAAPQVAPTSARP